MPKQLRPPGDRLQERCIRAPPEVQLRARYSTASGIHSSTWLRPSGLMQQSIQGVQESASLQLDSGTMPRPRGSAPRPALLALRGSQRVETSEPSRKSKKELKRNIPATANPRKKDPWQFTQTANSGGSQKNHRGLRVRPRCSSSNSIIRQKIADHLRPYGEAGGRKKPDDHRSQKAYLRISRIERAQGIAGDKQSGAERSTARASSRNIRRIDTRHR